MGDKFNIEYQYQLYLKRVGLKEDLMHSAQKDETRRAFFGAWGQMLMLLKHDVSELSEDSAIEVLEDMTEQVLKFFASPTP